MRSNQSERDYNRAIAEYDAALRLFPDDFPSLYRHGLAKHRKSDAARVYQHMATTAQSRNVIVVGIECASNAYGCWSSLNTLGIKSRHVSCANGRVCRLSPHLRRDRDGKLFKEIVGSLLRRAC